MYSDGSITTYRRESSVSLDVVGRRYGVRPKGDSPMSCRRYGRRRRMVIASDLHRGGLQMITASFNFNALAAQLSRDV
jgi:hypothetical protein